MTTLDQTFPERLVSERKAAEFFGCSVYTFRAWRTRGVGVPYIRIGRLCRYRIADLQEFLMANRVEPSEEKTTAKG
jgi:hypothetical protein